MAGTLQSGLRMAPEKKLHQLHITKAEVDYQCGAAMCGLEVAPKEHEAELLNYCCGYDWTGKRFAGCTGRLGVVDSESMIPGSDVASVVFEALLLVSDLECFAWRMGLGLADSTLSEPNLRDGVDADEEAAARA